jgi:hypothetical protein
MLVSADNYGWPPWQPDWLRKLVAAPDCSLLNGTHPTLRKLAKWLTVYFADDEESVRRWLLHAAQLCDRDVDEAEVDRLIIWAAALCGREGSGNVSLRETLPPAPKADLEEIYRLAAAGPRLAEYRAASPPQLCGSRKTDHILDAWGRYAGEADPWICFGADDRFWTRQHSHVRGIMHVQAQIVPSPMQGRFGLTQAGYPSEHSKEGTGERAFLVTEFDFTKLTPKGQPTICVPLLERCEEAGITALDIQAALLTHLATELPLWMTVFSGGKSLQGWFPCRGVNEEELHRWFNRSARRLGACSSTWCKSQFVRMPDGTRAPNREGKSVRQSIEFYNPTVL